MFVKLDENRTAQVIVRFGKHDQKKRETSLTVDINQNGIHTNYCSIVFCSPKDNFSRFNGRKYAMRRLFKKERLTKEDKRVLSKAILYGKPQNN